MDTSLLLAKIFGLTYLIVGLGILLNKDRYRDMLNEFLKQKALLYLSGVLALIVGLVIVLYHNVWEASWVVIITIIGWAALIKGIVLLLAPQALLDISRYWLHRMQLVGIATLGFGLVLSYYGFVA